MKPLHYKNQSIGELLSIAIIVISLALIIVGIIGAVIQVVPSSVFVGLGILIWTIYTGTSGAWGVFAITVLILLLATLAKFAIPGRQLTQSGIPNSTIIVGLIGAIAGYFLIPVVGFIIGLVVAIYIMEFQRTQTPEEARVGTITALKAVGISIAIEVLAALLAATIWGGAAIYYALA